jgi:hypothetical protein
VPAAPQGFTTSSLLGERAPGFAPAASAVAAASAAAAAAAVAAIPVTTSDAAALATAGLAGVRVGADECADFSFFDCHGSRPWEACVAVRDRCESPAGLPA